MMLTVLQKRLLNDFQLDFPLSPTPYRDIAESLGVEESDILTALAELKEDRFISRIGPVIAPNTMGISMLVAMSVPEEKLTGVAEMINEYPEVNHNYERESRFNLWFVLIAANEDHLQTVIARIEQQTGCETMQLPMITDFYINLGFDLDFDD